MIGQALMYMQHRHMVCGESHICHDLVLDQNVNVNAYSNHLLHEDLGVDHNMVILVIGFYGISSKKQVLYQPVTICTYCPVPGSYNNCNIIELTPKSTPFEAFDKIQQVILYGISDNMASLVQSGMYDAINIYDTTTNRLYVILFISDSYKLQSNTTIDGQVVSTGELVVKAQYLFSLQ